MTGLPPSVRRRASASIHAREERVLDNFKLSRDLTDRAYRGPGEQPTLSDYAGAATELGFEAEWIDSGHVGIYRNGVPLVMLVCDSRGNVVICVTEERP